MDQMRDAVIALCAILIAIKPGVDFIKSIFPEKSKSEHHQNVIVTSNGHGNKHYITREDLIEQSRIYASQAQLAQHSKDCAGQIYDKINGNYTKLSETINSNHKETMSSIGAINVSIAHLESMKLGK